MPSKEEKKRRAQLVESIVKKDTEEAIARMPMSFTDLGGLFDYLDDQLGIHCCDHTSRMTITFLMERNLNTDKILLWLEEFGGHCDCEVLANVEECWADEIEKNT